jgi:8-oxo-dGTP pyrophosphatase MutT (NUDIX family)
MTDAPDWPPPGSVIRRTTARVLPVDPDGRVLLLHGWDPQRRAEPFWFTIGGGVDDGESLRDAAVRELREEAGITVHPDSLGEPIGSNTIEFSWNGRRIVQQQTFYAVAVPGGDVSFDGQDQWERDTIDSWAWLSADDLAAQEDPAHPDIPGMIRAAIAAVSVRPGWTR